MTTEQAGALGVWLAAAAAIVLLVAFVVAWRAKNTPEVREERLERAPRHLQMLNAYHDWVTAAHVVKVILRKGVATEEGLQGVEGAIEAWTEKQVAEAVQVLLADREVRIAIAVYMERSKPSLRGKRALIMKNLLRWARPEMVDEREFV